MTPKEKAKELIDKFLDTDDGVDCDNGCGITKFQARQCAIIAVDLRLDGHFSFSYIDFGEDSSEYWEQVKKEIEIAN